MKKLKITALVLIALLIMSAVAFAEQAVTGTPAPGDAIKQGNLPFAKQDPLQKLESMKAKIQQSVTDGKMDKAKADEMIAQLDKQIKELKDFNALTLDQKKQKLIDDFTASVNKQVEAGKLTREKADRAIADYKAKIDKWDGTGYPFFGGRGFLGKGFGEGGFCGKGPGMAGGQPGMFKGGKRGFGGAKGHFNKGEDGSVQKQLWKNQLKPSANGGTV